ncbi:MAG: HAD family hydrolase [Microbacteriaceae bacterium]|jgi:HAD superfamily hydrolase (TIGR01484 family)|nr:HAD family hydrolase [Microbacteriaceae bacterium]MCI1207757.1 HAD family hydrolase [Microbacteriaceae bacterium]
MSTSSTGAFPLTESISVLPEERDDGRWLIAVDLDGTTVDADNRASDRVRRAVSAAQSAGHMVIIASGRPISGVLPVADQLELRSPYAVCSNGAIVIGLNEAARGARYRIVDMTTFDPAPVIETIVPHLPDARFAVEDGDAGYRFSRPFLAGTFGAPIAEVSLEDLESRPVTRVIVVSPSHDDNLDEFLRIVEDIGLHQVSYSVGWTAWLDIAPHGVNKATALEKVRRRVGIPRSRVLVVGDGYNDIEMLEWASQEGLGAAMGHADAEVRAHANLLVGDLEHDGVAEALEVVRRA